MVIDKVNNKMTKLVCARKKRMNTYQVAQGKTQSRSYPSLHREREAERTPLIAWLLVSCAEPF